MAEKEVKKARALLIQPIKGKNAYKYKKIIMPYDEALELAKNLAK